MEHASVQTFRLIPNHEMHYIVPEPDNNSPTIAAHMIGSVGVRQAAMVRHERYVSRGNRARTRPILLSRKYQQTQWS